MSVQSEIAAVTDSHIERVLDRGEHDRQERWRAEREDKAALHEEIAPRVAEIEYEPKPKRSLEEDNRTIGEDLKHSWHSAHADHAAIDKERRNYERYMQAGAQVRQRHGREPYEALEQFNYLDEMARSDPYRLAQWIIDTHADGRHAQAVTDRETRSTIDVVNQVYAEFEIPPSYEGIITSVLGDPKFVRTGDHRQDLLRAIRIAKLRTDHVGKF